MFTMYFVQILYQFKILKLDVLYHPEVEYYCILWQQSIL